MKYFAKFVVLCLLACAVLAKPQVKGGALLTLNRNAEGSERQSHTTTSYWTESTISDSESPFTTYIPGETPAKQQPTNAPSEREPLRGTQTGATASTSTQTDTNQTQCLDSSLDKYKLLFSQDTYEANIKIQTAIGQRLLRVIATNELDQYPGRILYSLISLDRPSRLKHFSINQSTGWISLKKAIEHQTYSLQVLAAIEGLDQLHASTRVDLTAVNTIDNPPVWQQLNYGPVMVNENQAINTRVYSVKASPGVHNNPSVQYNILRGSTPATNKDEMFYIQDRFEQDSVWADIYLNKKLDYETVTEYELTLRAENGKVPMAAEATVRIAVVDANDAEPVFSKPPIEISVPEGRRPEGEIVATVKATDKDSTYPFNVITYSISEPFQTTPSEFFSINKATGEITTRQSLDYERKSSYVVQVTATDGATSANCPDRPNKATQLLLIKVVDINDNPPYFDNALYEVTIDENIAINQTVLTLTAKDRDENTTLWYQITRGNVGNAFGINRTSGEIFVARRLHANARNRYQLRVVVGDYLNENYTDAVILVRDVPNYPTQDLLRQLTS